MFGGLSLRWTSEEIKSSDSVDGLKMDVFTSYYSNTIKFENVNTIKQYLRNVFRLMNQCIFRNISQASILSF